MAIVAVLGACAGDEKTRNAVERSERHYLLGADYFGKGLEGPALEETVKSIELDPENAYAQNLMGLLLLKQGIDELRMMEIDQCLDGAAAKEQMVEANAKIAKARQHFEIAARGQESFSEALNNLSVVALHFKNYDTAVRYGKQALQNILYRQPHLAHGNVGWAYYQKGDLIRAAKELRQAVFHEPGFCVGRYRLAQVYFDQKQLDKAVEQLEKVLADQRCPIQEAFQLAGMTFALRHDLERARGALDRCVQLAPGSCLARQCARDGKLLN
ncbi:MAG: tetratricopeptide repeat protein [Myxococcota bacterium]|mgnify:CR=1 FL=1